MDKSEADKLWAMMKSTQVAMLTTEDGGHLRARPMAASQKEFDGTLWFFTRKQSGKVEEVRDEQQVGVSYADPNKQNYVSLSGKAFVVTEKSAIDAHWSEILTTWFPEGKDGPDVALLRVEVEAAEYWDAPNSKLVHAFGYVKAKLTGEPPKAGETAKISV